MTRRLASQVTPEGAGGRKRRQWGQGRQRGDARLEGQPLPVDLEGH